MSHDYGCTMNPGYDKSCPHVDQDVCIPAQPDLSDPSTCHISPNNPWNESIPLYAGNKIIEQPVDLTTLSDRYADGAIRFIQEAIGLGQPFFVYMAWNHMHVPVGNYEPRFANTSTDRGVYGDTLRQLDASIGKIVDALDEMPSHVAKNTLILMLGDNGAPDDQCDYGGINSPFDGNWLRQTHGGGGTGKQSTWEGGHREPGLAVWPGKIQPGTRSSATLSALDILPTFLALAQVKLPPNRVFDGVDMSSVLFGEAESVLRPIGNGALFHPNSGGEGHIGHLETLRLREFKFKYRTGGNLASCNGIVAPEQIHDPPLIFDLSKDPGEGTPLPPTDKRHAKLVEEGKKALEAIHESIANDNTSFANYSTDWAVKPCCNHAHPLCMCDGQL
eukprot:g511.t1